MVNKYFDYQHNELKDDIIIKSLKQLVDDYENGEIIEIKSELQEIINAITEFEYHYYRNNKH